jgi:hypothetical protein
MTFGRTPRGGLVFGVALLLGSSSSVALAAPSAADSAAAEALFRDGKSLMASGHGAEACDKFAESQRLDPATGTLLELAQCDERAGRLASAWAEYTDVAASAQKAGRADRVKFARAAASRIEPNMAHLVIRVPDDVRALAGLQVQRDGTTVGPGSMGGSIPVDPGTHVIVASAPDHASWTQSVVVANGTPPVVVDVPRLAASVAPPPPPVAAPPPAPPSRWTALRIAGIAAGGAGVATLAVGSYFGAQSLSDWSSVKSKCNPSACANPAAKPVYDDARTDGTVATALIVAGGVLVAAGVTLFFIPSPAPEKATVAWAPYAGADGGGFVVHGRF